MIDPRNYPTKLRSSQYWREYIGRLPACKHNLVSLSLKGRHTRTHTGDASRCEIPITGRYDAFMRSRRHLTKVLFEGYGHFLSQAVFRVNLRRQRWGDKTGDRHSDEWIRI